jgi:tetratricopeptide (TPR) repeat protein
MVVDLGGASETAGELYWIACGFEEKDNGQGAMRMYERIVRDFPESKEADTAVLDIQRRIITDMIIAGDINGSEVLMDAFIDDFNTHPYAGSCLGRVAFGYYKKGKEYRGQRENNKAKEYFVRAEGVYQKILMSEIEKEKNAGFLYFYAAATYQELNQWENAITNYQKVVDDYPDFEYACGAQAGVGWCYELMVKAGKITKEQAEPLIEQAYTNVLARYPDSYIADYAAEQLALMSEERGDKSSAAQYYRIFLEKAHPEDKRIEKVTAKLSELEGTDR